jgi:O-antigen/teichoic acid export membrane protein
MTQGLRSRALRTLRLPVLREGTLVLAANLVTAAAKAAVLWALARWRGPGAQGAFSLALAGMSFGAVLLACGFDYANSFVTGRMPQRAPAVLRHTLWLFAAAVLLAPLWSLGFATALPAVLAPGARLVGVVAAMAAGTALMSLQTTVQSLALGEQRFAAVARANLVGAAVWVVLGLLTVRLPFPTLLAAWAVATAGFVAVLVAGRLGAAMAAAPDPVLLRAQLGYGVRTLPGSVARAFNLRAGLYVISLTLTRADVGVYGVILAIAELFLYLPTSLGVVVLGRASARNHSAADQRVVYVLVVAVGALAAGSAALAGGPLLGSVFGPRYAAGGSALAVLLLAAAVHAVGLIRLHQLLGEGDPMAATFAQVSVLALTLAGTWLLVPRLQLLGAALSALAVYTLFTLLLLLRRPQARSVSSSPAAWMPPEPEAAAP